MGLTLKEERQWLRIKKRKLKQMAEKEERGAFFFFFSSIEAPRKTKMR